ncbi:MAG: hypothetical protein MI717_07410 [Spirochaetales bacterium]|nr:hypothetical protein [Spirochaetales bacterium]
MKTRLSLVRALLHNPEILFLDEPTGGLDPQLSDDVLQCIQDEQKSGRTILLTSHDMGAVSKICHRVGFLHHGHIQQEGRPRELAQKYGSAQVELRLGQGGDEIIHHFPLQNLRHNSDFLSLLDHPHLQSIHSQEASLEDIFCQVMEVL